jgi:hypothetical protein
MVSNSHRLHRVRTTSVATNVSSDTLAKLPQTGQGVVPKGPRLSRHGPHRTTSQQGAQTAWTANNPQSMHLKASGMSGLRCASAYSCALPPFSCASRSVRHLLSNVVVVTSSIPARPPWALFTASCNTRGMPVLQRDGHAAMACPKDAHKEQ